jgi:hypothetical protein
MKILKFFLLAITIVSFTACSSDDSNNDSVAEVKLTNANLAGDYEITLYKGETVTSVTATNGTTVITERVTFSGDTFTNAIFTFNADGSYISSGSYVRTTKVNVTGQSPVTNEEIVTIDESGSYSLNNTNRTITLDGNIIDVDVFNGTKLNISGSNEENYQSVTESTTFRYKLRKL